MDVGLTQPPDLPICYQTQLNHVSSPGPVSRQPGEGLPSPHQRQPPLPALLSPIKPTPKLPKHIHDGPSARPGQRKTYHQRETESPKGKSSPVCHGEQAILISILSSSDIPQSLPVSECRPLPRRGPTMTPFSSGRGESHKMVPRSQHRKWQEARKPAEVRD